MLYVSQIRITCELSLYEAHRLIWRAFPQCRERPFLFHRRGCESLLVQSRIQPDWSFLDESVAVREKSFDTSGLEVGDAYAFYLCANPTIERRGFDDQIVRRVPVGSNAAHTRRQMRSETSARHAGNGRPNPNDDAARLREEGLRDWLERQGRRQGFTPSDVEIGPTRKRRISAPGRPTITLHAVAFAGTLRVEDPAALADACAFGIGRGKAFGFGLLMIRPLTVS